LVDFYQNVDEDAMMRDSFFLASTDIAAMSEPRECQLIGEAKSWDPPEILYRVRIAPPLPGYLLQVRACPPPTTVELCGAGMPATPVEDTAPSQRVVEQLPTEISTLLLCPMRPAYRDSDIDTSSFMVDMFAVRNDVVRAKYDARELIHLGIGTLHSNVEDAINASP
jgi:hypothetical protein